MEFIQIPKDSPEILKAYRLFRNAVRDGDILCKEICREEFQSKFIDRENGIAKVNIIEKEGWAFASGCIDQKMGKSYITMVTVERSKRRKGLGRKILYKLEEELSEIDHKSDFEISFFNPMSLKWLLPEKNGVEHPNMPGVDVSSAAYLFFKNCGYRDFAMQNSYYISLNHYEYPSEMAANKKKLLQDEFTLERYHESLHSGMADMMRKFGNPLWEKEILEEPSIDHGGRPILVPVYADRVCGFTGPLDVEKTGRGYFAGIGTDPDFRGHGLAKLMFCELCSELKKLGAEYMTLFTGEQNPARNIYEAAGFHIVRSWADMRKTHKEDVLR